MVHNAADKPVSFPAQSVLPVRIVKNVPTILGKRHIHMHSGTIHPVLRLWHKACKHAVPLCNGLYRKLECHDIVRCF